MMESLDVHPDFIALSTIKTILRMRLTLWVDLGCVPDVCRLRTWQRALAWTRGQQMPSGLCCQLVGNGDLVHRHRHRHTAANIKAPRSGLANNILNEIRTKTYSLPH